MKNGFDFRGCFQMKFIYAVCICSANELSEIASFNFVSHSTDARKFPQLHKLYRQTRMNIDVENTAAEWFLFNVPSWIEILVTSRLGMLIVNTVEPKQTKQIFLRNILIDIGEKKQLDEYLLYLIDYKKFIKTKVEEYTKTVLNKIIGTNNSKTALEILIENEIVMHIQKVESILKEQLEWLKDDSYPTLDAYLLNLRGLIDRMTTEDKTYYEMLFTSDLFGMNLDSFKVSNFVVYTHLLVSQLGQNRNEIFESIITHNRDSDVPNIGTDLFSNLDFPRGLDPIVLLTNKMIGCPAQCPFCKAPCKYECKDHPGEHVAFQHRPLGVIGRHWFETKQLCTCTCQSAASCDEESGFDVSTLGLNDLTFLPLKSNRTKYPDWNIIPDRNFGTSLYWKWFMVTFHDDLVKHFQVKPGDIPPEWERITWDQAKESLNETC